MTKRTLELTEHELSRDWVILDGPNLIMRGPGTDVVRAFSIMSGVKGGSFVAPTPAELARYSQKWSGPLALAKVQCMVERKRRSAAESRHTRDTACATPPALPVAQPKPPTKLVETDDVGFE